MIALYSFFSARDFHRRLKYHTSLAFLAFSMSLAYQFLSSSIVGFCAAFHIENFQDWSTEFLETGGYPYPLVLMLPSERSFRWPKTSISQDSILTRRTDNPPFLLVVIFPIFFTFMCFKEISRPYYGFRRQ